MHDRWIILRTSPGRTLPLVDALVAREIKAWSPREMVTRRRPRSKLTYDRQQPIAATFVFVRDCHMGELLTLLALPISPVPPFSLFRRGNRIPVVDGDELIGLNAIEDKAARREKRSHRYIYPRGARVRTDEPAFAGLVGVVEGGDGKHAVVSFGSLRMKIATWLLVPDHVGTSASSEDSVARAA